MCTLRKRASSRNHVTKRKFNSTCRYVSINVINLRYSKRLLYYYCLYKRLFSCDIKFETLMFRMFRMFRYLTNYKSKQTLYIVYACAYLLAVVQQSLLLYKLSFLYMLLLEASMRRGPASDHRLNFLYMLLCMLEALMRRGPASDHRLNLITAILGAGELFNFDN